MKLPPTIVQALLDPAVTDLCINGSASYVDRGARSDGLIALEGAPVDPTDLKAWVLEVLSKAGKSWDARIPFVDAPWAFEGRRFRIHVVFPPISDSKLLVSIRKLPIPQLEDRWKLGGSGPLLERLAMACRNGESIVIAGSTGSGKTTLASDLLSKVGANERIVALEDTPELCPDHPHFISLQSRTSNADGFGEIPLRMLLRQALRMRPDRLVLGECRGAEVMDLLQALNTGHRGGMATLHANSPRDALRRIETMALLSGTEGLSIAVIREWMASSLHWVVQVERSPDGHRRIRDAARICGIEAGVIVLRPVDSARPPVAQPVG